MLPLGNVMCYLMKQTSKEFLNSRFIEEGKWNRKLQHILKSEFHGVGVHSLYGHSPKNMESDFVLKNIQK